MHQRRDVPDRCFADELQSNSGAFRSCGTLNRWFSRPQFRTPPEWLRLSVGITTARAGSDGRRHFEEFSRMGEYFTERSSSLALRLACFRWRDDGASAGVMIVGERSPLDAITSHSPIK